MMDVVHTKKALNKILKIKCEECEIVYTGETGRSV